MQDGTEVSRQRFAELVSLYLDNAASVDEMRLLKRLVQTNPEAEAEFRQACRIHIATCRMFGKAEVRLSGLGIAGRARRRNSSRKAAVEWSVVAAFMVVCLMLFKVSQSKISEEDFSALTADLSQVPSFDLDSLKVFDNYVSTKDSCSVIYINR